MLESEAANERELPPAFIDRPEIEWEYELFWKAYLLVHNARMQSRGPISLLEIREALDLLGIEDEDRLSFTQVIVSVDSKYRKHIVPKMGNKE